MEKLRECPFCNKDVNPRAEEFKYIYGVHYNKILCKWIFSHECNIKPIDVSIVVYGDSEEEVIKKWNGVHEE